MAPLHDVSHCARGPPYAKIPDMDLLSLSFYALVCAVLSLFAPQLGGRAARLAVGALVGVIAAAVLPTLRVTLFGG